MTVTSIPAPKGGAESSNKLLNNNNKLENTGSGLSFSAAMNETASNGKYSDQRYMTADGKELTAEEVIEMLESGNVLPGMNLPSLSELQQYKFQTALNAAQLKPITAGLMDKSFNFDSSQNLMNDKFAMSQQQFLNQQFNQGQFLKPGAATPEQFLVAFNSIQSSSNTSSDNVGNGFSAAYGMQLASGAQGTTGVITNSFSINTPVQHPQWNQSVGQSIQWMVNNNIQQVEIKLNPPDLGLLDIRLSMHNDQATVNFVAHNSAVREALESAMPRLRDMLEESGISLADANVSEHSLEHGQDQQESNKTNNAVMEMGGDDLNRSLHDSVNSLSTKMNIGLLDTYA